MLCMRQSCLLSLVALLAAGSTDRDYTGRSPDPFSNRTANEAAATRPSAWSEPVAPAATQLAAAATRAHANPIDSIGPGTWYEVPNSHLANVLPSGPIAREIRGWTGPTSIMDAWNGGTYDTKRDRLIVWGGGHADYAGNEMYAFDLNTLQWQRLTDPSSLAGFANGDNVMPDGRPVSRHTYGGVAYIPDPIDRFFAQGGSDYQDGHPDPCTWLFDLTSKTWQRKADLPVVSYYGSISAYDPVRKTMWFQPGGGTYILEFNPHSNVWIPHGNIYSNAGFPYGTSGAIDPVRRLMVAVGDGSLYTWALSDSTNIRYHQPATSGDREIQAIRNPGFVYHPSARTFVAWSGGDHVYILDPSTWRWTKRAPAAGNIVVPPAANSNGTFGRFQYVPSKQVFAAVSRIDQDVYIYRLSSDDRN